MKTIKQITAIALLLVLSSTTHSQNFLEDNGFKWTDKNEFLSVVNSKEEAIELCTELMRQYSNREKPLKIYELSKVPVFWWVKHPEKRSKVLIIYCIKYKDGYDVVLKEIKNKSKYFFSVDEDNGEIIDFYYTKS